MAKKSNWDFSDAPLVSRVEARASNLKRYFTGAACTKGHVAPRQTKTTACVQCIAESCLAWQKRMYLNDGEEFRRRHRVSLAKNPVSVMYRAVKSRALARGIEFSIARSDIVIPEACPCCGNKMAQRTGEFKKGATPTSPSLDRINPNFGYVPGNIAVICWRCNELKRDGTADEFEIIVRWMRKMSTPKPALSLVS